MKVAIVHDSFIHFGGAERVLISFIRMFPHADIYTSLITDENKSLLSGLTSGETFLSPYDHFPLSHWFPEWYKPLIAQHWEHLDLSRYDLVISSSHSFSSKSVKTTGKTTHISYIHTPPRYLYNEYNESRYLRWPVANVLFSLFLSWMRQKDYEAAQRPDILIANSQTVQKRIQTYYDRNSTVIYPPVGIPKSIPQKKKKDYFLCVSRLVKQKGVHLAVQACNQLKKQLCIVGVGPEEKYLRSLSGPTIRFFGWVPDEAMSDIYAGARALLYPAIDEDFGITPVEAMAHGIPVIAHRSGGVTESVVHGKTGWLFDEWSIEGAVEAIQQFEMHTFSDAVCRRHAQRFSKERFAKDFSSCVKVVLTSKTI